jgi:Sec-independent protein translocase protein TatA
MKILLLLLLVSLVFGGGARRLGALVKTVRQLPGDYRNGKRQADDPASVAKDITPKKP